MVVCLFEPLSSVMQTYLTPSPNHFQLKYIDDNRVVQLKGRVACEACQHGVFLARAIPPLLFCCPYTYVNIS